MNRARSQAKHPKPLKVSKLYPPLSCLIAGFDAFTGQPFNISEAVIKAMPESLIIPGIIAAVPIQAHVLPTSGKQAWAKIKPFLNSIRTSQKPSVVIMLGLAASRKNISLERFALNIRDAQIKDNAGRLYSGQAIEPAGPQAIRTNAPLEEIQKYLSRKRITSEISNFCGTFVCNEIYFQTLRYFEKSRFPHLIMFIHLPLPSSQRERSSQISFLRSAIIKAAQFNCLFVLKQTKNKAKQT